MKKQWQEIPPVPITLLAIAKSLGLEMKQTEKSQNKAKREDVYYDEDYYQDTEETPWRSDSAKILANDFRAVGGVVNE